MKAIDKAWELNLAEETRDQYKTKEDLIEDLCPSEFGLEVEHERNCNCISGCNYIKCWNDVIIEEENQAEEKVTTSYLPQYTITNEDRFNTLRQSPICGICLNNMDVEQLKHYLKDHCKDGIVHIKQGEIEEDERITLQYDDIPKLIKWLQDVYDLTTNLKAEIDKEEKYTNFYLAREHMHKGGKCEYEGKVYYIFNGVMYLEFSSKEDKIENRVAYLSLEDIDSEEWLILDK